MLDPVKAGPRSRLTYPAGQNGSRKLQSRGKTPDVRRVQTETDVNKPRVTEAEAFFQVGIVCIRVNHHSLALSDPV